MKKSVLITLAAIFLSAFFMTSCDRRESPYELYEFEYFDDFISWLVQADTDTLDDNNTSDYRYGDMIEQLKNDNSIIYPLYNGYFDFYITVWPDYKEKNWRCVEFRGDELTVYIHRINDNDINIAEANGGKFSSRYGSYLGVGGFSAKIYDRSYKMLDKYYAYVITEKEKSAEVLQKLSFEKIKLTEPDKTTAQYDFNNYNEYTESSVLTYFVFLICVLLSAAVFAGTVIFIKRKNKITEV